MGRTCPPATSVGQRRCRHPSGRCDHPTNYPALTLTAVRPLVCQPCRSIYLHHDRSVPPRQESSSPHFHPPALLSIITMGLLGAVLGLYAKGFTKLIKAGGKVIWFKTKMNFKVSVILITFVGQTALDGWKVWQGV
eukprot:138388-Rhodomonas_salina.2